jgi:alpha-1,2-mannosyltransferase
MARAVSSHVDPYLSGHDLAALFTVEDAAILERLPPYASAHPPFVGILFQPLALLGYLTAEKVWLVLDFVFLLGTVWVMSISLGRRLPILAIAGITASLVAWAPVDEEMEDGQIMLLVLLLCAVSFAAFTAQREWTAGSILGLSLLIKPVAAMILFYLVLSRRWRALTGALSTLALGIGLATAVIGIGPILEYVMHALPTASQAFQPDALNISVWSLGQRFFDGTHPASIDGKAAPGIYAPPLVHWTVVAGVTHFVFPAAVGALVAAAIWRSREPQWAISFCLIAGVLLSPISWSFDLVLLIIPAAWIIRTLVQMGLPSRETNWALGTAILLAIPAELCQRLAFAVGGAPPEASSAVIPFAASLLTLEPMAASTALALLLWWLGRRSCAGGVCV